jgi:hypothetical protein
MQQRLLKYVATKAIYSSDSLEKLELLSQAYLTSLFVTALLKVAAACYAYMQLIA